MQVRAGAHVHTGARDARAREPILEMKTAGLSKTLVIAEKPSVAQDIVRALTPVSGKFEKHEDHFENDQYVVSSAVGHLVEIAAPEAYDVKRGKWSFAHLPVIPPHFDLKPIDKTKSRLSAVVKLAKRKDVGALVNACDAGREGELIFRLIEQYAGGAKPLGKPVQRLWLQSMTPQAIRDGFASCAATSRCARWPTPRAAAPRPTGWSASTAPAP
jgi:DNA topoisomerase III